MRDNEPTMGMTVAGSDPPTTATARGLDTFIELLPGSVVDEIYEIDAKLGAGAMGEVYAARHLKLGKRVAIKVIGPRLSEDEGAIERFAQEAQTLAQIQHPAIVAVDHVGELADGRAYFVMEYLRGESLHARLARDPIALDEALRILDQMARGLEAAHAQNVTHRDLKPENTFLVSLPNEPPIVKLLDFGLAKLAVDVDRRSERTQSGVAIGTPMYMSPEQARGGIVDHRTDIYALGCVAYELLLGCCPFEHTYTVAELYAAHLHATPPLPRTIWPDIPVQLDLVLFAMLAKDPAHRPTLPQIRMVIATVVTARASGSRRNTGPLPHPGASTMRTASRSRGLGAMALAVAALIGGIVIGAAAMRDGSSSTERSVARSDQAEPVDAGTVRDAAEAAPHSHDAAVIPDPVETDTPAVTQVQAHPRSAAASHPVASVTHPPVDAGVDAAMPTIDAPEAPMVDQPVHRPAPQLPKPAPTKPASVPLNRNQTINPFTKHATKATVTPSPGYAGARI